MTWVKLDDQMINHPKIEQVGVVGLGLHIAALCYANQHLTDGFISHRRLELLIDMRDVDRRWEDSQIPLDHPATIWADVLVSAGIWEKVDGGYQIHDYLDYQPSRREVLRERDQRRSKRVAAGSEGGKQTASKRVANVQQTCSNVASKRAANVQQPGKQMCSPVSRIPYPYPVPDPVPGDLPPNPPLAGQEGGISHAALRALEGSNRKRDIAAASAELTLEERYLGRRA